MGVGVQDPYKQKLPSLDEIRACIPKECFEKSALRSIAYWLLDLTVVACLYKLYPAFEQFGILGQVIWTFATGTALTSIFVIGHDCGHGTFSNHVWLNDLVGHLTHGMIFAPYWPWQKSHRQHHTYTSHLEKDMGHGWVTEKKYEEYDPISKFYAYSWTTAPIRWYLYTTAGLPDGSHFWPGSSLFKNTTERVQCAVSAVVCLAFAYAWYVYCGSPLAFLKLYVLPELVMGSWMIIITYLHHQTDEVQVYEPGNWSYVKAQLQTVDRPYGFFFDEFLHNITDGHVAHHLFFTGIPHYHLKKATAAIQKKLEPLGVYRKQDSWDFPLRFAALSSRLNFLVGAGPGLLMYDTHVNKGTKEE